MCVFVRVPPLHPALPGGPPVARGCAAVSVGWVCPPPSTLVFFRGGGVAVPLGLVVSVRPSPLFRAAPSCFFFFFAWCVSACSGCPSSWWAAAPGLVLPVLAGWSSGAPLVGGLAASCGVGGRFRGCGPFSPAPPCFFFRGVFACSSLCLPWAGARTGRLSVWFSGLLLVVAFFQALPRPHGSGGLCTRWARCAFLPR